MYSLITHRERARAMHDTHNRDKHVPVDDDYNGNGNGNGDGDGNGRDGA